MTFSYDLTNGFSDLARVRFYLGDVHADAPIYTDEVINAVIAETGSWQKATLALLRSLVAMLTAQPDFQADWLRVDTSKAIASYRRMIEEMETTLSLSSIEAGGTHIYRADSDQTESPYAS